MSSLISPSINTSNNESIIESKSSCIEEGTKLNETIRIFHCKLTEVCDYSQNNKCPLSDAKKEYQHQNTLNLHSTKESTTQAFESMEALENGFKGILKENDYIYSRLRHPSGLNLEKILAKIDGHESAAVFASGLAAITAGISQFTKPDAKIIIIGNLYGGTHAALRHIKESREIIFLSEKEFLSNQFKNKCDLVYFESAENPTLKVANSKAIIDKSISLGAQTMVDNTFTPITMRPSDHRADFTVTSLTKYMNGKSSNLGGSISGKSEYINKLLDLQQGERMLRGGVMAPSIAKEFIQNIQNLPHRINTHTQLIKLVKQLFQSYDLKVKTIDNEKNFQNLRSCPNFTNSMLTVNFPTKEKAMNFGDLLSKKGIIKIAVSLGNYEKTYVCRPAGTTHSELNKKELEKNNITEGLLRFSIGNTPNLLKELEAALKETLN